MIDGCDLGHSRRLERYLPRKVNLYSESHHEQAATKLTSQSYTILLYDWHPMSHSDPGEVISCKPFQQVSG
jgi:hypothetical protein